MMYFINYRYSSYLVMINPLRDESLNVFPTNVSSISFATHCCLNCQYWTLSVIHSAADVTCPCPLSVFNYFHNVHNFSLVPHPHASISVLMCDVEHVSFHVVLCCRQFLLHFFFVNVRVSVPYVIAGRMHWLNTFLLSMLVVYPSYLCCVFQMPAILL